MRIAGWVGDGWDLMGWIREMGVVNSPCSGRR